MFVISTFLLFISTLHHTQKGAAGEILQVSSKVLLIVISDSTFICSNMFSYLYNCTFSCMVKRIEI